MPCAGYMSSIIAPSRGPSYLIRKCSMNYLRITQRNLIDIKIFEQLEVNFWSPCSYL